MDIWQWFGGVVKVQLTGADTSESLTRIGVSGIDIMEIHQIDTLNVQFAIRQKDLRSLYRMAEKRGDRVEVCGVVGFPQLLKSVISRPVLLVGILLLAFLSIYLPGKILFVRVEGNSEVPAREIIERSAQLGLGFGADRREVRSEKVKNALLEAMPQLQWAGVNTNGCVATILVRERQIVEKEVQEHTVSSIVAARDGVIAQCTVTRGNPVCKIGQAVKAGEVLISGYTDCGISIRATRAEGEVYALTKRNLSVVAPLSRQERVLQKRQIKKYSVIIGKKRINFYKGSGISDPVCDKMYLSYTLTLPGGFQLPVTLVTETWSYHSGLTSQSEPEWVQEQLSQFARDYILGQMVAGEILNHAHTGSASDDVCRLDAEYACMEMIGQVRNEEIYGEHD